MNKQIKTSQGKLPNELSISMPEDAILTQITYHKGSKEVNLIFNEDTLTVKNAALPDGVMSFDLNEHSCCIIVDIKKAK